MKKRSGIIRRLGSALTVLALAITTLLTPFSSSVASAAVSGSATLTTSELYTVSGIYEHKFIVDGLEAYCIDLGVDAPATGTYSKIDLEDVIADKSRIQEVAAVLYYSYGYPGFDATMWPSTDWYGNACTADTYRVFSHMLIADVVTSANLASANILNDQDVVNWINYYIVGYDASGTLINSNAVGRVIATELIDTVPDYISDYIYILETGNSSMYNEGELSQNLICVTPTGIVKLQKTSSNTSITEDNDGYSLEGAVYGIYSDASCTTQVGTLTTDADGNSNGVRLEQGTYYVKEITPATGYYLDERVYTVELASGVTEILTVGQDPVSDPLSVRVRKVDAETGESVASGGASLEGAEYTVLFFAGDTYTKDSSGAIVDDSGNVIVDASGNVVGDTVDRTWVIATDEYGQGSLDTTLVEEKSDEVYLSELGSPMIPLGTVVVYESQAPTGYLLSDEIYCVNYTYTSSGGGGTVVSGDTLIIDGQRYVGESDGTTADQVKRGDFSFTKSSGNTTSGLLVGVPFLITSNTTGESHVIVTDENGQVNTSSSFNAHTYNTNANDAAVTWNDDGTYTVDESALDAYAGIWFSGSSDVTTTANDDLGALPYDTYTVQELRVSANEGLGLATFIVTVTRDGYEINLGTIDDSPLAIMTTATSVSGDIVIGVGEEVTIVDSISYEGLTINQEYTVVTTVMDAETGEAVSDSATTTVTPKLSYGTFEIEVTLDVTALIGRDLVVFEQVYDSDGLLTLSHEDLEDELQTVTVDTPEIGTSASSDGDMVNIGEVVTIVDTVTYSGLNAGETYTLTGTLMDAETGEAITVEDGPIYELYDSETGEWLELDEVYAEYEYVVFTSDNHMVVGVDDDTKVAYEESEWREAELTPVTATAEFVAEDSDGTVEVVFIVDTTGLAGKTLVVFESLTSVSGKVIATHEDLTDEGQTVVVKDPTLGTTATSEDGEKTIDFDYEVSIVDVVEYTGLNPGETYTLVGTLMNKETGEAVSITTTYYQVYDAELGEWVDLDEFIAGLYDGEYEYYVDNDGHLVVTFVSEDAFEDVSDESEEVSAIALLSLEGVVESEEVTADEHEDELESTETSSGYLVTSDEAVFSASAWQTVDVVETVTVTSEFVPETSDGTTEVVFTLDTTSLDGAELVVFENLYSASGVLLVSHEDLEDEEQTVTVADPEIGTTLVDAETGEHETLPSETTVLTDTVAYSGLVVGNEYTLVGILMDQETGEPVLVNGEEVTASTTFVAESSEGSVEVTFEFDSTELEGTNVVAYEYLYYGDLLIAEHTDLSDMNQTVEITDDPDGSTWDKTGGNFDYAPYLLALALIAVVALLGYAVYQHNKQRKLDAAGATDGAVTSVHVEAVEYDSEADDGWVKP